MWRRPNVWMVVTVTAAGAAAVDSSIGGKPRALHARPTDPCDCARRSQRRPPRARRWMHPRQRNGGDCSRRPARRRPTAQRIGDLDHPRSPDGVAAGTRQNAHHVDLNRNFPFGWRPLGHPGDQQYAGPQALSEPESRLARTLILRLRPRITIWFYQPLDITDRSEGDARIEARFAALSRLPLTRLPRYPGSVATWENHQRWGGTAFVVNCHQPTPGNRQWHATRTPYASSPTSSTNSIHDPQRRTLSLVARIH